MNSTVNTQGPESFTLPLWPSGAPDSIDDPDYKEASVIRNEEPYKPLIAQVARPTLEVFLPHPLKATCTAVVICPGGGYSVLAYEHEGVAPARWFAKMGAVGVALKYRLPSGRIMKNPGVGPLQDVQEAIRTVRNRAAEWSIDPGRVGVMGFSAGGNLAAGASTLYRENVYTHPGRSSARPDF
jgi:acetyl esterase/lipase